MSPGNSFFQNRVGFSEQRESNVIYREKTAKGAATQEIGRAGNSWNQSFGNFVTPNPDNMRTSRGGGVQRRRGRYGRWQGYYRCFDCKLSFFFTLIPNRATSDQVSRLESDLQFSPDNCQK